MRAVLFTPTWELLTTGTLFTLLSVTTWWRDNFASEAWKKKLELKGLLPHWHPAIWLCIGLVVLLMVVIQRAFRLWRQQKNELAVHRAKPIPEFVIDLAREEDEVVGFKIRNVWSQNLYNVSIANINSRVGEIAWWENYFPCLEARNGEKVLKPTSYPGEQARFQDVPSLRKALQETPAAIIRNMSETLWYVQMMRRELVTSSQRPWNYGIRGRSVCGTRNVFS